MKKLISILLSVVLILTAAAAAAEGNDHLDGIKARGYLIVGTEGTWSPYTYHDEEEKLVGFDVEVAKLIADYIGVDVQYSETVWSSIFGSLDAGQIDLVVNEVSYTEERAVKYDFSIPYTFTQRAILVKADNDGINGLGDIAGKIASGIGSRRRDGPEHFRSAERTGGRNDQYDGGFCGLPETASGIRSSGEDHCGHRSCSNRTCSRAERKRTAAERSQRGAEKSAGGRHTVRTVPEVFRN